ncbi:MAG: hypothetical protein Q9222_006016 [Ikaeria aurantiellina]
MKLPAHLPYLPTTSEVLRRVFLPSPVLHSLPIRHRSSYASALYSQSNTQPRAPGLGGDPNDNNTDRPRDEAIRAPEIQVVAANNTLSPPTTVRAALASIDRATHFLLQVGTKPHPFSPPTAQNGSSSISIPVCKILSKKSFRLASLQKATQVKRKSSGAATKEVELNWNIADHDLQIRIERMRGFLREGRRVEVVFGKKRKGWMRRLSVQQTRAEAGMMRMGRELSERSAPARSRAG